jgi:hypothetical protein
MLAIDLAGDHREVLEVGAAVADRLEAGAVEERGDVSAATRPSRLSESRPPITSDARK